MFANKPDLMKRAGGPRIELHPDDAAERDLQSGDTARVFNARGGFEARVEACDRVRPVQVERAGGVPGDVRRVLH
jgi:anaerobic selenocysteine-containing dehydrogenase